MRLKDQSSASAVISMQSNVGCNISAVSVDSSMRLAVSSMTILILKFTPVGGFT